MRSSWPALSVPCQLPVMGACACTAATHTVIRTTAQRCSHFMISILAWSDQSCGTSVRYTNSESVQGDVSYRSMRSMPGCDDSRSRCWCDAFVLRTDVACAEQITIEIS